MQRAAAAKLHSGVDMLQPGVLMGGLASVVAVLAGVGLAWSPFLALGTVIGAGLVVFALMQPLALVALMLVLGPIDLSFMTGGFKSMFEHVGGLDMNGIRLIGMSGALTLVVLAERSVARQLIRPAAAFYTVLVAFAAVSLAYTPAPIDGSRLLLKLAYPLLVFLVVCGIADDRRRLDRLMDAVLIGAAVIALVVNPLYLAFGDFEREIGGWIRLRGAGTHQNPFAFYLLVVLLLAFVRFTTRRQWRYLLLSAVCSFWMVLTITRIAFGATLVAMFAVGVASAVVTRNTRALIAALAIVALLAVPFAPPVLERTFGFMPGPGELMALVSNPRALFMSINWEGRMLFWPVVYQAFLSSPFVGLGLGSSAFVLRVNFPGFWSDVVHNDYLRLLCDLGLLGATLMAAALGAWLLAAARSARLPDRTIREYALPAVGCIAGLTVIGITDNPLDYYGPYTQYLGFLCGGALAGAFCFRRAQATAAEAAQAGTSGAPAPARATT